MLRPGGRLLLSTPDHGRLRVLWLALSRRAFDAHFDPRADHLRFYTRAALTPAARGVRIPGDESALPGCRRAALLLAGRCAPRGRVARRPRRRARSRRRTARARHAPGACACAAPLAGLPDAQRLDVVVVDLDRFGVGPWRDRFGRDRLRIQVDRGLQLLQRRRRFACEVDTGRARATSAGWRVAGARARCSVALRLRGVRPRLLDGREREQRLRGQRIARDRGLRLGAAPRGGRVESSGERFLGGVDRALRLPLRPGREQRRDHAAAATPTRIGVSRIAPAAGDTSASRSDCRLRAAPRARRGIAPPATTSRESPSLSRAAQRPRPASQPAHSSATHASPGTYQVQSTNECTPNTTTRQSMLSMPMRSGV